MARTSLKYSFGFIGALTLAAFMGSAMAASSGPASRAQWPIKTAPAGDTKVTAPGALAAQPARGTSKPLTTQEFLGGLNTVVRTNDGKTETVPLSNKARKAIVRNKAAGMLQAKVGKLVRVDPTQFPYTAVGILANGCSGVLVARKFVLTQAYCVYNIEKKEFWPDLSFTPALNVDKAPFGTMKWKKAYLPEPFLKGSADHWYALVELEQDRGDETGWMGFAAAEPTTNATITGYAWQVNPELAQWEVGCKYTAKNPTYYLYDCGLKKPLLMGGAPVWENLEANGGATVIGIHGGAEKKLYWGQRINEEAFNTIIAWIDAAMKGGGGEETGGEETGGEETGGEETGGEETGGEETGGEETGGEETGGEETGQ
jgi:V8-like Glu-specific endopeptidase